MNAASKNIEVTEYIKRAKEYIYHYSDLNVWHSIETIPASIIGEFFQLWQQGFIEDFRKIELDETDQYFRIVKT